VPAFQVKLGAGDLSCVDVPLNRTHSLTSYTALCNGYVMDMLCERKAAETEWKVQYVIKVDTGNILLEEVIDSVFVAVGNTGADVRPHPAGAMSKTFIDLQLELFLDETKRLAQSVVECIKENGVDQSIDEVQFCCVDIIELNLMALLVSLLL